MVIRQSPKQNWNLRRILLRSLWLLIYFLLVSNDNVSAQVQYPLLFDRTYSSIMGAHNIVTLHRGIYGLESRILKTSWFDESNFGKKAAGLSYRLAKTILVDNVLDHLSFLAQHEVFGHGARYREFGFIDNEFTLNLPPPYGDGKGWSRTGYLDEGRALSYHERLLMVSGGVESNTILSGILRDNWLQRGSIHYRESILYLLAANDLSAYILRTKYGLRDESGNDILNYLKLINAREGHLLEREDKLTLDDLAARAWISILNPFQYYSLYTYFKTYLWSGDESFSFPMFRFWGIRYLPCFRMGLTPFGPELYWESFVATQDRIFEAYFRYGDPTFHEFWGLGVSVTDLIRSRRISIHARVDMWDQPSLLLGGERIGETRGGLGVAVRGTIYYRISRDKSLLHLTAELGYKTAGYLEGEHLSGGPIIRLGISFFGL